MAEDAAAAGAEIAARRPQRLVLFVAYFFPPLGGGGVQRTVKFIKYLWPLGWRSEVITGGARDYWVEDPTLAADLPPATRVHRTRSLSGPALLRRLARRGRGAAAAGGAVAAGDRGAVRSSGRFRLLRWLSSCFLVPDAYVGWLPFALRATRRRLAAGGVDVLLTTSSPDSAHLVGLWLRRRYAFPWVADFRDPWVRRLTFRAPTPVHRWLHTWLEGRVLAAADRVLVTNAATRDDFLARHPALEAGRFRVIPNGFEPEDLAPLPAPAAGATPPAAAAPPPAAAGPRLHLLHAGLLSGRRTLQPVLVAFAQLFARNAELRGRLQLTQLGPREQVNDRLVDALGLGDCVRFRPPVAHDAVLRAMQAADALLLIEHGGPRGALITPGKIFEYLASRRPLLAVVPEGPAAALVRQTGAGEVAAPGDTEGLCRILARWLAAGPPPSQVSAAALAPYARPRLAAELAGVLAALVAAREAAAAAR